MDSERLKPGYEYNEELARAICESVCMIVVYSPRYERHEYCLREYTAMERLEEKRKALLKGGGHGRRFIITIVFGGDMNKLPERIKGCAHCSDFSRFTLASRDISRNPDFLTEIEKICKVIYELYQMFEPLRQRLDGEIDCTKFSLPAWSEIVPWRP